MNVVMVNSVPTDVEVWTIFRGVVPSLAGTVVALALLLVFPEVATLLRDFSLQAGR